MPGQPHVRVRVNGTLSEFDIFSWGFALSRGDFFSAAEEAALRDLVQTYFTAAGTGINSMATLTEVTMAQMDASHRQVGDTRHIPAAGQGSMNQGVHPPQVACRVSLDDQQRGRSHRGGWYLPASGWPIIAGLGMAATSYATACRDSTLTFIRGVNDLADGPGQVCIASKVLGNLPVTRVRVGTALDTIRTRRNGLVETYSVGTV